MFESKTASDGVLRACVVVVVAARAKSVASRTRMVCGAEVMILPIFGATKFIRSIPVDIQSRSCYLTGVAIWL